MKVTVITSRYPRKGDIYSHMFVHTRCLEMIKQGVKVEIFVPEQMSSRYKYEGVEVHKMQAHQIVKRIDAKSVIYLHLLNIYPFQKKDGWPIYKYIIQQKLPFVFYVHGNEVQKYSARRYEFDFRLTDILKWIKKDFFVIPKMQQFVHEAYLGTYIFPSKWMKEEMQRNLKLEINKFHVIPNGIDTHLFMNNDLSKNRHKLITIRSLSQKVYDIEKTVEVMEYLPTEFTLDIYGKGVYENKYKRLIKKKGLDNRVRIISAFFEKAQMNKLFKNYGIFISTTRMDSQGITMMEGMSAGLLVASTDNSSKREFISDGETGILAIEAKEIAAKIIEAVENPNNFLRITKNARRRMEEICLEKVTAKEISVLKQTAKLLD
ncbi:glycosyltransferase family 4 protein [Aequorivita sediminis]|uniref:glycosyltransferase family 4 protein n=1 Tax=Aequorivita sediminis TaxID=3073653 RepID=UPI0028AC9034|nr:glycosyltransferase family 4 protein [Aequorivita sp. F6058]